MPDKKLTVDEFALKIKAKYPQYKDMDNYELSNRIVEKYPDYSNSVDLKKKVVSKPGGYGSQLGSQTFQPTEAFVPAPLIGQGAKEYKAPSKQKAAMQPETSYGQNFEAMLASGLDIAGRMASSLPSGFLDLSIQAFGTPGFRQGLDAEMVGKFAEKELGIKEAYNPFSPNNYLANLYKERGKAAKAAINLKYGGSVTEAVNNGDYLEAGKLLSLNVVQALPVMAGLVATRGAGVGEAASLIGLGLGTQATTYQDLKEQYPDIDKNTLLYNSILTGIGEAGSELVGTSLLYNQGRKLLAKGATKEAEDLVKGGVKSYLDNAFKKTFVGSAVLSDASGEMANQVWKNFVDKETVDPNKQLLDGVLDAGIVSLGMTGPLAGGIKVADRVLNPATKQTIVDNSNKIQEINKELDNPEVNTTTKALLLNQVSDLTEKVNDAIDEDSNIYRSLDEGQKETVNKIADEIEGLTESLQSSNISEPTKELLKGQIETLNTQLQDAIQKPSTSSQVPPVIEGGQNLQEGGEGVGQGVEGTQAPQEAPIQEPTAEIKPEEKIIDIENRRKEELKQFGTSSKQTKIYNIKVLKDPEARVRGEEDSYVSKDLMEKAFNNDISNKGIQDLDTIIRRGGYSSKELSQLLQPEINKINAKYNAELSSLETQVPKEFISEEVTRLREQEQQELAKAIPSIEQYKVDGKVDKSLITDPKDLKKYNKVYDKYDKLITPLLAEAPKEFTPQERVAASEVVQPAEKIVSDSLQKAKDRLAAARANLDVYKKNIGIAQDPKKRAKDLFEYHSSLVDVAKEYIKYGVKNVKDFAKELGEDVGSSIKAAWDEANGLSKKGMKDFIDATEAELIGITKRDVRSLRENMGEEQFEYETQTREKLIERASKKIEEGTNVPELIEKINNGTKKTVEDIDVELIRQYYASLTAAINEAPTPELLAQRKALLEALDKAKVSAGRAVQAFDGLIAVEDNLSKFLADESKFADLTPEEITTLTEKYERMQQVNKELEDRYAKLESEALEQEAKNKIAAIRASERKAKVAAKKMDFKDERKVYVDEFRKRLQEIRSGAQATIFPYQRELVELAPFVAKMAKSYVSEGIFDLKTIVEGIHDQFKNDIEGLSKEDIRDIIAGKYVDTKQTKDAKLAQIRDLKSQARIEGEIENLKNGLEKETKPIEKRKKSDRLVELEKELKEIKRRTREENAPSKLDNKKKFYQNKIDKLKTELASGDFAEVKEPVKITLDSEGLKLQDEYNQLVNETRERRDAKEREAMSKADKALEKIEQITGLKRLVQTALDLSIPLRQGVAVMLNPRTARIGAEAYVKMIKSVFNIDGKGLAKFKFDDKFYNRMMSEIERSPNYLESKADGIIYTELGSKIGEKRDESHPTESFVYKIPYLSAPFRASERAAAGWTNSARYELYNRGVKQLLAEGKTRENSPQAYEDMAARVMVDTGRGKIPGISDKAPDATGKKIKWALGKTMYGARLFASSIRKLNPLYYLNPKVDKTVRVEAFKDMIGYTTSQILFHVAIASAIGAAVSLDPDDSDFLKLRVGKKVIDLTAGQSTYIRTFLRLIKAVYLQSDPEVSKEDADKYSKFASSSVGTFFRNKLAPNTSYAVNAFMGSNSIGEKFDPYEVIKLYPMYTDDLLTAFEEGSMLDAAVILPIAISGLGYQEYSKNVRQVKLSNYLDTKDSDLKAFLNKNKLTVSSDINQEVYNPSNGDLEAMDKTQSDKFESAWAKYVIQEVKDNIPVIEAMKSDIFSTNPNSVTKLKLQEFSRKSENKDLTDAELKDKFYQAELKKKISSIKTDANDSAKEVVIGFPKDLLKVDVNINGKRISHSLTKQEVDKRVIAYKKYIKENQDMYMLGYNDYIANGETPENAKKLATKDLKRYAINLSENDILDTYYDEATGEFKF
jgi:hypothetical protein